MGSSSSSACSTASLRWLLPPSCIPPFTFRARGVLRALACGRCSVTCSSFGKLFKALCADISKDGADSAHHLSFRTHNTSSCQVEAGAALSSCSADCMSPHLQTDQIVQLLAYLWPFQCAGHLLLQCKEVHRGCAGVRRGNSELVAVLPRSKA